jgi:hypothetical protein
MPLSSPSGQVAGGPEQVAGSGNGVEMLHLRVHAYGMCLQGHVTTRSRPTVPVVR